MISSISLLGLLAGLMTTGSFMPQILKAWKTKDTKSISLAMYIIYVSGVILWLIYAFISDEIVLFATNTLSFIMGATMLVLKLRYK